MTIREKVIPALIEAAAIAKSSRFFWKTIRIALTRSCDTIGSGGVRDLLAEVHRRFGIVR
jgi:hypothetical protein